MSINDKDLTKDLTEEEYRIKYLKYKEKYIALKNQSGGLTIKCNRAYEAAGWTTPTCKLCIDSWNPIGKCCVGFKVGNLKQGFKALFKKGSKISTADQICECGHPASVHLVGATRSQKQDDLIDIFSILDRQTTSGVTKEELKRQRETAKSTTAYVPPGQRQTLSYTNPNLYQTFQPSQSTTAETPYFDVSGQQEQRPPG